MFSLRVNSRCRYPGGWVGALTLRDSQLHQELKGKKNLIRNWFQRWTESAFFFSRENQNLFRENFRRFSDFRTWIFFPSVKKSWKLPVKTSIVYVKISSKSHTWKWKWVCVKNITNSFHEIWWIWPFFVPVKKKALRENYRKFLISFPWKKKTHQWKNP